MPAKLFNRYEVLDRLGEGSQSTVFLVRDTQNENVLKAAKVLKKDYLAEHTDQGLIQEFQLLESVDHDNLVRVYECRFLPKDKTPVLVNEFVPGAQDLEVFLSGKDQLTFPQKLQITYQFLSALRYLHQKKIIHGDIKPSNILMAEDEEGRVRTKLIDFGVSHDLGDNQKKKRVGTPYYIAPEVVNKGLQKESDLYSLGVILYRLFICEELPYKGIEVQEILSAHFQGTPLFDDESFSRTPLPIFIRELIRACLSSDPHERPRNLANVIQQLRFEFPKALGEMPTSNHDTRLRNYLGMKSNLSIAQKIIQDYCNVSDQEKSQKTRNVLFVSAPSGGGKSRYLSEITKYCQKEKFPSQRLPFSPFYFWDQSIKKLLKEYDYTKTTKRMRGRLAQALKENEETPKIHLYSRYLQNLAIELDGLVLLIDGLSQQLSSSFLNTLKSVIQLKKDHENHKKNQSKLVLILTVNNRPLDENPEQQESQKKLANLINELNETFLEKRSAKKADSNEAKEDKIAINQWKKIPEQIRSFGLDGSAHLLSLSMWGKEDVKEYLREVFSINQFSQGFVERIFTKTEGNPGVLQALCNDALKGIPSGQKLPVKIIESLLLELSNQVRVHDLHVYKLKHYDEKEKALLAIIAALESTPKALMEEIWHRLFGKKGREKAKAALIRAFDDELIQFDSSNKLGVLNYTLSNQNLKNELQAIAQDTVKPTGFILCRILGDSDLLLNQRHQLYLSRFLGMKKPWAKALLELLVHESSTPKKLSFEHHLTELRKELENHFDFNEVDWDTRLQLDYFAIEISFLKNKYHLSKNLSLSVMDAINDRNDPLANSLRAKTQLFLGSSLRMLENYGESIDALEDAIQSELLNDSDHFYALGSLSICKILARDPSEDAFNSLAIARKKLRSMDPIRYAILTYSLGSYYLESKKYLKALPYLELAARIYEAHGETSRQIRALKSMGKVYYLLGRYHEALNAFNRTLPMAERMGLHYEVVDILIYIIRTQYMLGDFRKFAPACLQLTSICERINDIKPLAFIIEPATHAYLEDGKVRKAIDLVQTQLNALKKSQDPRKEIDTAICELLLVRIHQTMGNWQKAEEHNQQAFQKIGHLMGRHNQADSAKQVHAYYEIELIRNEKGPQEALDQLEQLFAKKMFSGFIMDEAYFLAFQLAVWAENREKVERYIPRCLQIMDKVMTPNRLAFYMALGKFYLDQNDSQKSEKALKKGAALLNMVTNHLHRAQLFDQQARLASRQGKRELAYRRWNMADQEFKLNSKTWQSNEREQYKETSTEWQEHRVIYMLMQAEVQ